MKLSEKFYWGITDTVTITKRNIKRYLRLPQLIFFSSVQPIMFLVLFNYVFGGAIRSTIGENYIDFLLPGILVQTVMFGGLQTGIGLAEDLKGGIVDRFRSLPMSRLSVIAGRTFSDLTRNLVVIFIMLSAGYVLGFRFHNGILGALGMVSLILLFSYSISWAFALVGLSVRDVETAQLAGFIFIFPLVFASAAFVPVQTMPSWLQAFANNQPVTFAVNSARQLALGTLAVGNSLLKTIISSLAILILFIPLSIWRYKKKT